MVMVPRLMRIGAGASRALPETLHSLGVSRPLVVTDQFLSRSGMLQPVLQSLRDASLEHVVFDGAVPDPTTASLDAALALCDDRIDSVVGIGGGSSMDSAKAIAVLATHGGPLRRFKAPVETPRGLPVVAVPTTAGTGSEVTKVSIVIDSTASYRMVRGSCRLMADS